MISTPNLGNLLYLMTATREDNCVTETISIPRVLYYYKRMSTSKELRTDAGTVTQKAHDTYGAKPDEKGLKPKSFPVFDHHSGESAIRLRGHAPDPSAVLDKVQAWAASHKDKILSMKARIARKADAANASDE
jgi:hypothetical protein